MERTCRDCGLILNLKNTDRYKVVSRPKRNIYVCNRCHSNREERAIKEYVKNNR